MSIYSHAINCVFFPFQDKKNKKTKMASETTSQAAVYKWAPKRQR